MFQNIASDAPASKAQGAIKSYDPKFESLRHTLTGSRSAVEATIKHLHKLNYAEPNDWSKPVAAGQPDKVIVVLLKRVRVA